MSKPDEPLFKPLKCLCKAEGCEIELRVVDMDDKVKLQIFNSKDIDSIIVDKKSLMEILK